MVYEGMIVYGAQRRVGLEVVSWGSYVIFLSGMMCCWASSAEFGVPHSLLEVRICITSLLWVVTLAGYGGFGVTSS